MNLSINYTFEYCIVHYAGEWSLIIESFSSYKPPALSKQKNINTFVPNHWYAPFKELILLRSENNRRFSFLKGFTSENQFSRNHLKLIILTMRQLKKSEIRVMKIVLLECLQLCRRFGALIPARSSVRKI